MTGILEFIVMFRDHILAYKCELEYNHRITLKKTDQEDLDGPQYVHGRSKGGAQVEAQSHSSSKLRTKGA